MTRRRNGLLAGAFAPAVATMPEATPSSRAPHAVPPAAALEAASWFEKAGH